MRISNIDSLSAYLDRLIVENIKLWHFQRRPEPEPVLRQQEWLVAGIRDKLAELFRDALTSGYQCLGEQRTFSASRVDDLLRQVEELTRCHAVIGEAERNVLRLMETELECRRANESRARLKNALDQTFGQLTTAMQDPQS